MTRNRQEAGATRRYYGWHVVGPLRWRFEFNPADCWIGAFTRLTDFRYSTTRDVWVCLLPMVPLHLRWTVRAWTEGDFEPDAVGVSGGQVDLSR